MLADAAHKQLKEFGSVFTSFRHREFWLFSLFIFLHFFLVRRWHPSEVRYWKKVIEVGEEYRDIFSRLQRVDDFCLRHFSWLRYLCWNTVVEVVK